MREAGDTCSVAGVGKTRATVIKLYLQRDQLMSPTNDDVLDLGTARDGAKKSVRTPGQLNAAAGHHPSCGVRRRRRRLMQMRHLRTPSFSDQCLRRQLFFFPSAEKMTRAARLAQEKNRHDATLLVTQDMARRFCRRIINRGKETASFTMRAGDDALPYAANNAPQRFF